MQLLVAIAMTAGLCLAIRLLWEPPPWLGWVADRLAPLMVADDVEQPGAAGITVEPGLLSRPFIERRLDALVEELERLDQDPDVFAKAFHTHVVRSAQHALLADASRLSDQPRSSTSQTFDVEVAGRWTTAPAEELEL
jgi:hypothetical protein